MNTKFFARGLVGFIAIAALAMIPGTAEASRADGPVIHKDTVAAYQTDVYTEVFTRGAAHVEVKGDGDTDLDCYVTSLDGSQVFVQDTDSTDYCIMDFTVVSAGSLRIVIKNRGSVYNEYFYGIR